jgi:NAD/NADP transhydrogenase beta subunit
VGDLTHHERLLALRKLQRWLDEAFRVPGTRVRFGWDPVVGLVPGAGDVLTALLGGAILVHAHQVRVPRVVQARMLINLALDLVIGLVPFAGDVADVFWKANKKNLALLERHAAGPGPASRGDWWFVGIVIVAFAALAALPLVMVYWLIETISGAAFRWW